MSVAVAVQPAERQETPWPGRRFHLLVVAGCLLGALWVFGRLWSAGDYLTDSAQDQNQWEWFFAVTAHNVAHLHNPLFTDLQNHPLGVNLMGNTPMLGLSVPLTPVTLLFGPTVTWTIVLTFGLAATAACWYRLLLRLASPPAAALGGAFCAFAPPMISHANGHPNLAVLFVIPLIIGRLIRLHEGRGGAVGLGLLVVWQVFLGEEALLIAGTGLVLYALARPSVIRPMVKGLLVAGLVAGALLAYPLWWQFAGPQSYHGIVHGPAGNDIAAFTAFADRSLAGSPGGATGLAFGPTEQNAFFGWPLLILVVVLLVRLRARELGVVFAGAVVLSLGPRIHFRGHDLGIPGPWWLVGKLPLYGSVLETRVSMICVPVIGILLALATDRFDAHRVVWALALAQALVPILPLPLRAADRPPTPAFFTHGLWRPYAAGGRSIVPVPLPSGDDVQALNWQVATDLGFPLPEGYFVGPYGPHRTGIYGAPPSLTSHLLAKVRDNHTVPEITRRQRREARADLAYWHAGAVVLTPGPARTGLQLTLERLLGPSTLVGGVQVWDVRTLPSA